MKKILIISPYFAPENMVASIRFTKIAKYLKKMGYDVTVICSENIASEKRDRILENDAAVLERIYRVPTVSFNRKIKKIYAKLENRNNQKKKGENKTSKNVASRKKSIFDKFIQSKGYQIFLGEWIYSMEIFLGHSFKTFYKKNKEILGEFDCVISSYGPISSHILALYLKKNGICKKWIADFRDVVYDSLDAENRVGRKRKQKLAKMCVEADLVTAVTEGVLNALEIYSKRFFDKSIRSKAYCIPNGFDIEDCQYLESNKNNTQLVFAYCGMIYYNRETVLRNPRPLFKAFRELADERKIDLDDIRLSYAGAGGEFFLKFASEFGMEHTVVDYGFVERMDSLNIQRNADVILSLSWNTKEDKGIMTGKIYEAFLAQRNVLCLVSGNEPNSDLGKMIKACEVGFVWEEGNKDTIEKLKEWIYHIYQEKKATGEVVYKANEEEVYKYSYSYLAEKFQEIIEKR